MLSIFSCAYWLLCVFFGGMSIKVLYPFFDWLIYFLLLLSSCMSYLYILEINMTITKPYLKPTLYSSHPISLLSWSQNSSQGSLYFLPLVSDPSSFVNPLQSNIYLHYLRQFLVSGFLMMSLWLNSMNPLQNSPFSTAREMLIMPSPWKHYLHFVAKTTFF